jgi:inosine-uridine nucleoside N-ribohydrolase
VLDTDLGYDPDDLVALAVAARHIEHLVVVTADETRGRRARLARYVLDLMDRSDVPVITGIDLGGDHRFLLDDQLPAPRPAEPVDLVEAITRVCADTGGPVSWVGQGPMSNLAAILRVVPDLAEQLVVTQMGGWLDHYRDRSRASHNFHTDPGAAGLALRVCHRPRLVLSEHTNNAAIDITPASLLYRQLAAPHAPAWARLIAANFSAWFAARRPGSWLHDPLTVSAALGEPFARFRIERVRIERDARLRRDPEGRDIEVTSDVDYHGFLAWLIESVVCW